MTDDLTVATGTPAPRGLISRRNVLRAGAVGAIGTGAAVAFARSAGAAPTIDGPDWKPTYTAEVKLVATDGWVSMPESLDADGNVINAVPGYWPDELAPPPYNMYVFGFRNVSKLNSTDTIAQRGAAQISAPLLAFDEGSDVKITLTNLGLSQRPDLVDGHTIHWHGFNNAIPLFDGVPELSASVPIGKSMVYYYRPHDAGTYMYHCHFEDVEHVQMGMTGLVFVRPLLNYEADGVTQKFDGSGKALRYIFNDPTTRYDREFPLFLSENQPESHWRDAHIQITDWAEYKPGFALFNGRAYPDTVAPNTDPMYDYASDPDPDVQALERLRYQPRSSRIDCNPGDVVALRMASLGYIRHTITVDGIPLHVVGADASQLKSAVDLTDNSYVTNSVDIAPGESRDVLFTAPSPGKYLLYDRNFSNLSNSGDGGYGGMITEIHVHAGTAGDPFVAPQDVAPKAGV